MAPATAFGGGVAHDLTIDGVEPSAILDELAPAPTTDRDHLVVFFPLAEGIVGSVDADKAATVFHELDEAFLGLFGPHLAIVVAQNGVMSGEVGFPSIPVFFLSSFGGAGGDGDRKGPAGLECFLEHWSGGFPVVVVLPIEEEDLELGVLGGREEREIEEGSEKLYFHERWDWSAGR